MSQKKLDHMKSFFDSLTYVVGFPCPHRNQKNYIEMDGVITWAHVFNLYLRFKVKDEDIINERSRANDSSNTASNVHLFGAKNISKQQTSRGNKDMDIVHVEGIANGEDTYGYTNNNNRKDEICDSIDRFDEGDTIAQGINCNNMNDPKGVNIDDIDVDDINVDDIGGDNSEAYDSDIDDSDIDDSDVDEKLPKSAVISPQTGSQVVANKYRDDVINEMKKLMSSSDMKIWASYKMTAFATFYKYRRICHPDITLQKLKEDMCDTCIKYKTMLDDENLNESDKENINIALNVNVKLI